ncbi:hypothetical protein [Ahniella affigens]|nr:hypothetical protein [Ahniella affigens]
MKRYTTDLLAFAFAAGSLISSAVAAQDALVVQPDTGAFPVGTNQNLSYATGAIRVTGNLTSGLNVSEPTGASPFWSLSIDPIGSTPLAVGCYERTLRFSSQTRPGLDFAFGGSGCSSVFGRYQIRELATNQSGTVTALAVDFAIQCESYGEAVSGKVRFNSTVPTTGGFREPVANSSGSLQFSAAAGAIGGSAPGGVANIALSRQTLRPIRNFEAGPSMDYNGPLPGDPSGFWSLDFAPIEGQVFGVGNYPNATRFPFQAATAPGLDFSYNGSGCNTLVGGFNVSDVSFDSFDQIPTRLLASFDQRCGNAQGPLTSGVIDLTVSMKGPAQLPPADLLMKSSFETGETTSQTLFSPTCQWD